MAIVVRMLTAGDVDILCAAAPDVFDEPVDRALAAAFLSDPRHHIAAALDGETLVGFASGVVYVHPDKPQELWVNEVSVAEAYRQAGVATRLMRTLFAAGRAAGCAEAWVLTERDNAPAMRLYQSLNGTEPLQDVVYFTFALDATTPVA